MAKKVPLERLADTITKVLDEYTQDVTMTVKDVSKRLTKEGTKAVKAGARSTFGGTGKYAAGWTSQFETGRFSAQGIIYNEKVPGLPHLLENGHAKRGGGRVAGRAHIKPVEEQISQAMIEAVERDIS